jgi:hypothetical protein
MITSIVCIDIRGMSAHPPAAALLLQCSERRSVP